MEKEYIDSFENMFFDAETINISIISENEIEVVNKIINYVDVNFKSAKYILGLALDFCLIAQVLNNDGANLKTFRPEINQAWIYKEFPLIEARGSSKANTFSVTFNGKVYGIRKLEELVLKFFHKLERSAYPSAYVYNTGQWKKNEPLILLCFMLSEEGRYLAVQNLISYGLENMKKNTTFSNLRDRDSLFSKIIKNYPRSSPNENGGLVFQAISFGYIMADRPHLSVIADKVRTGSARQKRTGDIDCYLGISPICSLEVKDLDLNEVNYERQISEFIRECNRNNIFAIVITKSQDEVVKNFIKENNAVIIDENFLVNIVSTWDDEKQNIAVNAVFHYLSHIEQNIDAVYRLGAYIQSVSPSKTSSFGLTITAPSI